MTETQPQTETFDEYKSRLRGVLIRVASEQGYCDGGLNEVLEELGLAPKKTFHVAVRSQPGGKFGRLPVTEAQTEAEARAWLESDTDRALKLVKNYIDWYATGFEVVPPPKQPEPGTGVPLRGEPAPAEGEWYATSVTSGGPNQCRVDSPEREVYCTRPLGHAADWHVAAGKNTGVLSVWEAHEGDTRSTPAPAMPAAEEQDED